MVKSSKSLLQQSIASYSTEITIDGKSGLAYLAEYSSIDCSGQAPTRDASVKFTINYEGPITVPSCSSGEKVNIALAFPLIVNGTTYTQAEYEALPIDDQDIELLTPYSLFCLNDTATTLYVGDEGNGNGDGDGTSDATRPTTADFAFPLDKVTPIAY